MPSPIKKSGLTCLLLLLSQILYCIMIGYSKFCTIQEIGIEDIMLPNYGSREFMDLLL